MQLNNQLLSSLMAVLAIAPIAGLAQSGDLEFLTMCQTARYKTGTCPGGQFTGEDYCVATAYSPEKCCEYRRTMSSAAILFRGT